MPQNDDGQEDNQENENGSETPPDFESWIAEQGDDVKALLDGHTKGLKSALDKERKRAGDLEKSLRDAAKDLEKGSEAQNTLLKLSDELAKAQTANNFYVAAHRAGVNDPDLAYLAAEKNGLIRSDGSADFAKLKETYPQLFGAVTKIVKGNPGNGTGSQPTKGKDMNKFIRASSGRQ